MATQPEPIDVAGNATVAELKIIDALIGENNRTLFPMTVMSIPFKTITTREEWLQVVSQPLCQAVQFAADVLEIDLNPDDAGFDIAVAPFSTKKTLGKCRYAFGANGKTRIQLCTSIESPIVAVHVLLHEIVHYYTHGDGHRGRFKHIMKRLNSEGRMTATSAGEDQTNWINEIISLLRPWEEVHVPFKVTPRGKRGKGSRLIKCECLQCGFTMRTTRKWIEANNERFGGDGHILVCPTCVYDADPMWIHMECDY